MLKHFINLFYHNSFFKKLIPTMVYCLQKELEGFETVLDTGCGPDSPL